MSVEKEHRKRALGCFLSLGHWINMGIEFLAVTNLRPLVWNK